MAFISVSLKVSAFASSLLLLLLFVFVGLFVVLLLLFLDEMLEHLGVAIVKSGRAELIAGVMSLLVLPSPQKKKKKKHTRPQQVSFIRLLIGDYHIRYFMLSK